MSEPYVYLTLFVTGKKRADCQLCGRTTTCLSIEAAWTSLGRTHLELCNGCFGKVTSAVFSVKRFFKITIKNTVAAEIEYAKEKALDEWQQALEADRVEAKLHGMARAFVQLAKDEFGTDFNRIRAIKFMMRHTGLGLKESKNLVEHGLHQLDTGGNGRMPVPAPIMHNTVGKAR